MPTFELFIYRNDAITFDTANGTVTLDPDYDPKTDRYRLVIEDDDTRFDGDTAAEEVGEDTNQTATVYDSSGNIVASGPIYAENFNTLTADGQNFYIDLLEIGGVPVGYASTDLLTPGVVYNDSGTREISDSAELQYSDYNDSGLPCFGPGTQIACPGGEQAVETLRPGDTVITRSHGRQPVLWAGSCHISRAQMADHPNLWPIAIEPRAFGQGKPARRLVVSPQHRMVVSNAQTLLLFNEPAAFVAARHLTHWPGIRAFLPPLGVTWHHILLPEHCVIMANRLRCESLLVGDESVRLFPPHQQRAIAQAVPTPMPKTALPCLTAHEARLLRPVKRSCLAA